MPGKLGIDTGLLEEPQLGPRPADTVAPGAPGAHGSWAFGSGLGVWTAVGKGSLGPLLNGSKPRKSAPSEVWLV